MKPGDRLSKYRIVAKIGAGGMGEVYHAHDTKLDRNVALKILPDEMIQDSDRHTRFHREAKLLAAFSHPNVASIYNLEEHENRHFLVLELIEGEDLSVRLARGKLPVIEALQVAKQIATAMEAAHDKGIVHRDLKPQNVMISSDSQVRVLDFGLAKLFDDDPENDDTGQTVAAHLTPTLATDHTQVGVVLGTAAYMSPEQARGTAVDHQADVWAFGCVLFEMLTGTTAFAGETVSDTIASILKTEPDWSQLPKNLPPRMRDLLERCLAKDPRDRVRDIGDARLEVERTLAGHSEAMDTAGLFAETHGMRRGRRLSLPTLLAATAIGLVLGAGLWSTVLGPSLAEGDPVAELAHLSLTILGDYEVEDALISPDGSLVACRGQVKDVGTGETNPKQVYLRNLAREEMEPVPGSIGVEHYAFSPDGHWLAMLTPVDPKSNQLQLTKVPVDGSAPPLVLLDWPENFSGPLLWLPDGDILARTKDFGLVRIPQDGGPPRSPVAVQAKSMNGIVIDPVSASVLPDGIHALGWMEIWGEPDYHQSIYAVNLNTGDAELLIEDASHPRWSDTGHLLFSRGTTLLAVPFDPRARQINGGTVALTDGLHTSAAWDHGWFEVSLDGTLLHRPGGLVGSQRQLVWFDADLRETGPWSDDRRPFTRFLKVARNGSRLATVIAGADGLYDLWISDVQRPGLNLFVDDPKRDSQPMVFTPDGERLIYTSFSGQQQWIYSQALEGNEDPILLLETALGSKDFYEVDSITSDGKTLVVHHTSPAGEELMLLPAQKGSDENVAPIPLLKDAANADLSPDSQWLTYQSDVSGRWEVYVRSFNSGGHLGPAKRVSTNGGMAPYWYWPEENTSTDILYVSDGKPYRVKIDPTSGERISRPQLVFPDQPDFFETYLTGGIMPDGRLLFIKRGEDEKPTGRFTVVLGWGEMLKQGL